MQKGSRSSMSVGRTTNNALALVHIQKEQIDMAAARKAEQNEVDEKFGLPETWARHSIARTKQDNCNICQKSFSMVSLFGVGDRDFYCKSCGYAVCSECSKNKKFLSKDAAEKFRVCDFCDTKLDNIRLRLTYDKLVELKDTKIELTGELLQKLKD